MSDRIQAYLDELRRELAGADPATVQDALGDAEEHLRSALAAALQERAEVSTDGALGPILDQYGTAAEVARAYRETETRFTPPFALPRNPERHPLARFFGVLGDPRAYAALGFMLLSLVTGIIFFTWAVTGISLTIGMITLIVGLPFFGLFVFSLQGLAVVEGRLIEAMLGIRMPRRPASAPRGEGLIGKFVARVKDRRTWTTLFYFILKLPLGVLSFSVFIVLLAYALQLILLPLLQYVLGFPLIVFGDDRYYVPAVLAPVLVLAGVLELVVVLHLARISGRGLGSLGKGMLVQR